MFTAIIEGEPDLADVCYLIAVVLAAVAVVGSLTNHARLVSLAEPLLTAAVGFVALGLLVL
jgi:hypothetical protein